MLPDAGAALPPLGAGLALYVLATLLRGERWRALLRDGGARCSRPDAAALTTIGYMGNNALPARAGDLLKAFLSARRTGAPGAETVGVLVAERMLDAAALGLVFAALVTTLRLPLGVPGWALALVGGGPRWSRRLPSRCASAGGPSAGAGARRARRARAHAVAAPVERPRRRAAGAVDGALARRGRRLRRARRRRGRAPQPARRAVRHGAREHRRARPRRAGLRRHLRRRRAARRARSSRAPATPRRSRTSCSSASCCSCRSRSPGSSRSSRATADAGELRTILRARAPGARRSRRRRPRRPPRPDLPLASSPAAAARRSRRARRRGASPAGQLDAQREPNRAPGARLAGLAARGCRPCARPARGRSRGRGRSRPPRTARCRGGSARRSARGRARRRPGPRSETLDRRVLAVVGGHDADGRALGRVAQRVVDEDAHDARDGARVARRAQHGPGGGSTTISTPRSRRLELELGADRAAQLAELDRLGAHRDGGVEAAEVEQLGREAPEAPQLALRARELLLGVVCVQAAVAEVLLEQLERPLQRRQRRTQLVRRGRRRTPAARPPGGAAPPASPRACGRGRRPRRGRGRAGGAASGPSAATRTAAARRRARRRDSVVDSADAEHDRDDEADAGGGDERACGPGRRRRRRRSAGAG